MRSSRRIAGLAATLAILAWLGLAVWPPVLTARVAAAAATETGASDEASPRPDEDRGTVYVGNVGSALDAAVISLSRDGRTMAA